MASNLTWKVKIKGKSLPKKPIIVHIKQGEDDGTADSDARAHVPRPRSSGADFTADAPRGGKKIRAFVR